MDYHSNYCENHPKIPGSSDLDPNNLNEITINECKISAHTMFKQNNMASLNHMRSQLTESCNICHQNQNQNHCDGGACCTAPHSNQRILQDLSYSRPFSITTADTLVQKSSSPSATNQGQILSTAHQESLPMLTSEQSRQAMYTIPGGICSLENKSTSIHISFSETHSQPKNEETGLNPAGDSDLSLMTQRVHRSSINEVGNRYGGINK